MDIKTIAEYMYSLLINPLKRVNMANNQFYILFQVLGNHFQEIRNTFKKVQRESVILTAEDLISLHGIDRKMPRYEGETEESYRKRLMFKNVLAETAGTENGIIFALELLGYQNPRIVPAIVKDNNLILLNGSNAMDGTSIMNSTTENRTRWAEFYIYLDLTSPIDFDIARKEVRRAKPAGSLPIFAHSISQRSKNKATFGKMKATINLSEVEMMNLQVQVITNIQYLDNTVALNGSCYLNAMKGV